MLQTVASCYNHFFSSAVSTYGMLWKASVIFFFTIYVDLIALTTSWNISLSTQGCQS
jgi:hypothetical protein